MCGNFFSSLFIFILSFALHFWTLKAWYEKNAIPKLPDEPFNDNYIYFVPCLHRPEIWISTSKFGKVSLRYPSVAWNTRTSFEAAQSVFNDGDGSNEGYWNNNTKHRISIIPGATINNAWKFSLLDYVPMVKKLSFRSGALITLHKRQGHFFVYQYLHYVDYLSLHINSIIQNQMIFFNKMYYVYYFSLFLPIRM